MNEKRIDDLTKYVIVIFTLSVLFSMCFLITPERYGDGQEYMLITEAFQNHFSPDVSKADINAATENYKYNFILNGAVDGYPGGFFTNNGGKNYSYHFWFYSLLVMPIKVILHVLKVNELRCFQIFNAIIYICTLWYMYKKLKISKKNKFFLIMLLMINPAMYYIVWTHPEIFTFSLVCISLVMYSNKEYEKAIFTVSVAAMQNQPIIFLGGMYFIDYFITQHTNGEGVHIKEYFFQVVRKGTFFIPFFIPLIFYYINYGTFSLIASNGFVKINGIIKKVISMIFDLNQGILPFMPIVIILFFAMLFIVLLKDRIKAILYMITILVIMCMCSLQTNWNAGESGIMRYDIWIVPILMYFFVTYKDKLLSKNLLNIIEKLIIFSIIFTGIIIASTGLFKYKYSYVEFNPLAKFVLNRFPALYSPQEEIFAERILNNENDYNQELPIIYKDQTGNIKKVLLNNSSINDLLEIVDGEKNIITNKTEQYKNYNDLYYLNFQTEKVKIRDDLKIESENRKYRIRLINQLPILEISKEYLLKTSILNLGQKTWLASRYNREDPIGISYHWIDSNNNVVVYDGARTYFTQNIHSQEEKIIDTKIVTPSEKGNYKLVLDLLQEHVAWFSDSNEEKYIFDVEVN